ncbi:MAG: chemotaxis protein CheX [Myxococcales bacterium]|nr:chemotaxis protein CheX [Myxococcales bacterium]
MSGPIPIGSGRAPKAHFLGIDPRLLEACSRSTIEGLEMSDVNPRPIGASRLVTGAREISVLVSLYGSHSGTVYLNLSRQAAFFLVSRMLDETLDELSEDLLDCVSEIGNIVAGRFKDLLREEPYGIQTISLPALVFGASHSLYHARGLLTAAVTFEIPEMPMHLMQDRFISTSIALMRR